MAEGGFESVRNGGNCMIEGTAGQGTDASGELDRCHGKYDQTCQCFRGLWVGWGTWCLGLDDLPFPPQRPILVGYLAKLVSGRWCSGVSSLGKYRQIFGALRPHGEQVKVPGRSSQLGSLR